MGAVCEHCKLITSDGRFPHTLEQCIARLERRATQVHDETGWKIDQKETLRSLQMQREALRLARDVIDDDDETVEDDEQQAK